MILEDFWMENKREDQKSGYASKSEDCELIADLKWVQEEIILLCRSFIM